MTEIREMKNADKAQAKCIWAECFPEDSGSFIEWYFDVVYDIGYGAFIDGELVSMVCVSRRVMSVRGADIPCAVIQGVGTLPEHRRRGYAAAVMRHALAAERQVCSVAMLTTFMPALYTSLGFAGYLRTGLIEPQGEAEAYVSIVEKLDEYTAARFAAMYNGALSDTDGWLVRTARDFINKFTDQTCFAREVLIKAERGGELVGYAFAAAVKGILMASEAVGEAPALAGKARDMGYVGVRCAAPSQDGELHSMLRVLDFERAFEAVPLPEAELTLKICDGVIAQNDCTWHVYSAGRRTRIVATAGDPEAEMDISAASALLVGATEGMDERFAPFFRPRTQLESY